VTFFIFFPILISLYFILLVRSIVFALFPVLLPYKVKAMLLSRQWLYILFEIWTNKYRPTFQKLYIFFPGCDRLCGFFL